MAIVLTDGEFVTLDESLGLQNTGVAVGSEDNNDEDIALADLDADFADRLFGATELNLDDSFPTANGVAENDFIALTEGSTLTGFVKSNGDPLLAFEVGVTNPATGVLAGFTTVDGENIYLFSDVASGLGAFMFLGVDASGDIVLAGHLQADGTISTVQFEAITNPNSGDHDDPVDLTGLLDVEASGTLDFDFDTLPSGNNLFDILGPSPDAPAIVIFGENTIIDGDGEMDTGSDRIFTSQAGPDATIGMNNQMFNPGDAAFFVYIKEPHGEYLSGFPGGLDSTEADDADNILYDGGTLDVTAAKFTIAQIQGNSTGSMTLTTYLGAADQQRDLLADPTGGGSSPNIIMVKVTIGGVTTTFDSDADPAVSGFDVSGLGTATVTLTGVDDGYAIEFITDDVHNRVRIEGVVGKFDIGGFTITEGITIHEPVGDRIVFEDDGPSVGDGEATPALTVDDSDFATDDTASYAGLFDVDFGTDGGKDSDNDDAVDTDAVAYALGIGAGDSGLFDTLTGEEVVLSIDGLDVIGTVSGGTLEVFRISVDVDTGDVTLDQSRAVVHDDPDDPEEDTSPAMLASADLITLTATATDDDGDTADNTVNIGDTFNFEDDGPTMDLSGAEVPALITDDTDTPTSSDSADFSGLFSAVFGNDGEGDATTYALGVSGPDAVSGLTDTLTGEAVVLNLDPITGEVVGTTADTDQEVLRISVDADGNVTLTQIRAVVHDDPDDPEEDTSPAKFSAPDLVTLTATAYDGDDDHDDATAEIGLAFNFEDDGPAMDLSGAEVPALITDDTDTPTSSDSADFSGLFSAVFGKDGEGDATTYALGVSGPDAVSGLTDTLTGEAVVLNLDPITGEVVGTTELGGEEVLRISVDADGNVTLNQLRSVVHDDPDDPEEDSSPAKFSAPDLVTLTTTAYDGDDDHDDATAEIGLAFNFEDDGPSIEPNADPAPDLLVDETVFGSANADFSGLFTSAFGADGPKDENGDDLPDEDAITYALDISGAGDDTGLIDSLSGEAVILGFDGLDVIGVTEFGGDEVFRVSADPDTGDVTLTQSRAVKHDDPLDPDEATSPAVLSAPDLIKLIATVHDGDGDHESATINIGGSIKFEDDGPGIGPILDGVVDFASGDTVSNLLGAVPGADGATAKITDFTESFDFGFGTVVGVQEGDQIVTYYEDENGNGVIDADEDNAFFRLSLDTSDASPANWSYLFETLADPAPNTIEFDFDELPSGANLFGVVGESATDPAILVFGKSVSLKANGNYDNASDVIKTSQGGTGATIGVDSQMFDPGDGAYFVYIDDPVANFLSGVPGGLSSTEADNANNVQYTGGTVDVHTASLSISQTQGNQLASMKLTTFLGTAEQGKDMVLSPDGTSPNIDMVKVILLDGTELVFDADSDPAVGGVDVSGLGTTSVIVSGLTRGTTIEWTTDDFHNRVLVEGLVGKFDVGKFSIGETTTVPDAELNFEVTIEDFDTAGDTAVAGFTIGIDGDLDGDVVV